MHDSNTDQENLVGTRNAPIRCVDCSPEVNVMLLGAGIRRFNCGIPELTMLGPSLGLKRCSLSQCPNRLHVGTAGEARWCGAQGTGPQQLGVQQEAPSSPHTRRAVYWALLKAPRQLRSGRSTPKVSPTKRKEYRADFPRQCHLLPQYPQYICHRWFRWICKYLGSI